MSTSDRKKKLEELAARRKAEAEVAEGSEEEKKQKKPPPKEKKSPTIRSKNKPLPPLKPKGGRAATQNEYEDDGFIVDDDEGNVLDSESQPSSGENFIASDGPGSDYSDGVGSSKRKKKKVTTTVKKSKVSSIKKKTTKRKKVESDDEDSSEEEVVKKKSSKKSKKKKGSSDEGELSDIREDELDELDANQIIKGRRTRGKQIDFRGQDPYDDDE